MDIKNLNNPEDVVSIKESDRERHVYLKIGEGQGNRTATRCGGQAG